MKAILVDFDDAGHAARWMMRAAVAVAIGDIRRKGSGSGCAGLCL